MCYTILFSTFFSLYPEQAVIFFLFFTIYFILSNYLKIKNNFINLILSISFFLFLILLNPNILEFLFRQISYYNQSNDWWAYFGAFILGSNNLILNEVIYNRSKRIYIFEFFSPISEIYSNRTFT